MKDNTCHICSIFLLLSYKIILCENYLYGNFANLSLHRLLNLFGDLLTTN
jgi:hypothetical protein